MPYKIKRIAMENLRSIRQAEIEIDNPAGLYRVGGRNGQGKSTGFYIGMSALLGLTSPLPLVMRGRDNCLYEIENGYGTFGFKVNNRKVTYYYTLNTGEEDQSSMTINNNICLDVIRAYTGFNVDVEFKTALNLNSKDQLNFIVTNGRTELTFLKELVYSEEIERLQSIALEREKSLTTELQRTSDKIQFIDREIYQIKTFDSEWIKQAIYWAHQAEETILGAQEVKESLNKLHGNKIAYLHSIKKQVESVGKVAIMEAVELKNIQLRNKLLNLKLTRIEVNFLMQRISRISVIDNINKSTALTKRLIPTLEAREVMERVIVLIKELQIKKDFKDICVYQSQINEITGLSDLIYNYKSADLNIKIDKSEYIKESITDCLLSMKTHRLHQYEIKEGLISNSKDKLNIFIRNSLNHRRNSLSICKMHLGGLSSEIQRYEKIYSVNKELNVNLDGEIYKDGRCILCYSTKSPEIKQATLKMEIR